MSYDTNQGGDEVGGDEAVVIESSAQAERDRFDNSTDEEGDDEHTGTIISCTPGYADTQLSTFPVFDSQETCDMCWHRRIIIIVVIIKSVCVIIIVMLVLPWLLASCKKMKKVK